jgi:hypothetical protein
MQESMKRKGVVDVWAKSWVGKKLRMTKCVQPTVEVGLFMKTHEWMFVGFTINFSLHYISSSLRPHYASLLFGLYKVKNLI